MGMARRKERTTSEEEITPRYDDSEFCRVKIVAQADDFAKVVEQIAPDGHVDFNKVVRLPETVTPGHGDLSRYALSFFLIEQRRKRPLLFQYFISDKCIGRYPWQLDEEMLESMDEEGILSMFPGLSAYDLHRIGSQECQNASRTGGLTNLQNLRAVKWGNRENAYDTVFDASPTDGLKGLSFSCQIFPMEVLLKLSSKLRDTAILAEYAYVVHAFVPFPKAGHSLFLNGKARDHRGIVSVLSLDEARVVERMARDVGANSCLPYLLCPGTVEKEFYSGGR